MVALLAVVLAAYLILLAGQAVSLISSGSLVAVLLGVGVLVLPVLGAVALAFELRFGFSAARLARRLGAEDHVADLTPIAELPRRPSGRVDRGAADDWFRTVRARVQAAPDDWRGWFALGQAYELAGDRRRARQAVRRAIELSRE